MENDFEKIGERILRYVLLNVFASTDLKSRIALVWQVILDSPKVRSICYRSSLRFAVPPVHCASCLIPTWDRFVKTQRVLP
jgi:hypothetical protein